MSQHASVNGLLWGDEGKGKIVDYVAEKKDIVCRYQGGPNAGHTVQEGGREVILHQVPSGILRDNKRCVVANGVVLNPVSMVGEIEGLREKRVRVDRKKLLISQLCPIIGPWHVLEDILCEMSRGIGTTLQGIGPAYGEHNGRAGISIGELASLSYEEVERRVANRVEETIQKARFFGIDGRKIREWIEQKPHAETRKKMLGHFLACYFSDDKLLDVDSISKKLYENAQKLSPFLDDTVYFLNHAHEMGQRILFEGAQGDMLDLNFGSRPYVTVSHPGISGIAAGTGFTGPVEKRYGVLKAFATRVGGGPFPTEISDKALLDLLAGDGTEVGATTGRARRVGWFDAMLAAATVMLDRPTDLVITKLDRLDWLPGINVCGNYTLKDQGTDGEKISRFQFGSDLSKYAPEYTPFEGWRSSTEGIESWGKLPEQARDYTRGVEEMIRERNPYQGAKVTMIGNGRKRENIIHRAA